MKLDLFAKNQVLSTALDRDRSTYFDRQLWNNLATTEIFETICQNNSTLSKRIEKFASSMQVLAENSMDMGFTFTAVAHGMTIFALNELGNDSQKQSYIEELVSGRKIGAICNAELGSSGSNIKSIQTIFYRSDNGQIVISGHKGISTNLPIAQLLFVTGKWAHSHQGNGFVSAIVDNSESSLIAEPIECAGLRTGSNGKVHFDNHVTSFDNMLGGETGGIPFFKLCFSLERIFVSAAVSGILKGAIKHSLEYIGQKKTSGYPIEGHQYIQDKIIEIFKTHSNIDGLLEKAIKSKSEADLSLLKLTASTDGIDALIRFMELLGGRGYTLSNIAQKTVRDALSMKALGGTAELHKMIIWNSIQRMYEVSNKSTSEEDEIMERVA